VVRKETVFLIEDDFSHQMNNVASQKHKMSPYLPTLQLCMFIFKMQQSSVKVQQNKAKNM
jgi:hypothetical protein